MEDVMPRGSYLPSFWDEDGKRRKVDVIFGRPIEVDKVDTGRYRFIHNLTMQLRNELFDLYRGT